MKVYLSVSVKRARTTGHRAKASLIVDGKTAAFRDRGGYGEGPNTVLWATLGALNQEAKKRGIPGDITPDNLKPDTRVYRRTWYHDGKGWIMLSKEPSQ